jgi:redox-sensitive bicupin YhaK (pirin superfamily)
VQVARGEVRVNGASLKAGDGAAIADESALDLTTANNTEVLLFYLP